MSERRDDTPEPSGAPPPAERERTPGSYYYDDGTGYENYAPEEEDEDEQPDDAPHDGACHTSRPHAAARRRFRASLDVIRKLMSGGQDH